MCDDEQEQIIREPKI